MTKLSIKMEFLDKIRNTYPHVYCIDGTYYYLGLMIFRKCKESEIKTYIQLMDEYNHLNSASYTLETSDCKDLQYYHNIMISIDEPFDECKHNKIMKDIDKLLSTVSAETLLELTKQYEAYRKIMRWCSDIMY